MGPMGRARPIGPIVHPNSDVQHMQQQTGVPPIIMQQVHPPFMQAMRQSQQPWIMSQQALSPLVQVTQQPSFVISTLQAPMVRQQVQTIMPFIMQHMLHMPPAIMVQRFCIMVQAAASSHMQVIFMPPGHFSIFMVQRGTIIMFGVMVGMPAPIGIVPPMPVIAARSIIIAVVMYLSPEGMLNESRPRFPPSCGPIELLRWRTQPRKTTKTIPDSCHSEMRG